MLNDVYFVKIHLSWFDEDEKQNHDKKFVSILQGESFVDIMNQIQDYHGDDLEEVFIERYDRMIVEFPEEMESLVRKALEDYV